VRTLALLLLLPACLTSKLLGRTIGALVGTPAPPPQMIVHPVRSDVRLAVSWIGHATLLIQIDDKLVLTDPVLTETVAAGLSRRLVAVGIDPANIPPVDVVAISHMHVDHLSLASLDLLGDRIHRMVVPEDGVAYLPEYAFPVDEVPTWHVLADGELRLTAVPIRHPGFRYGVDTAWMTNSATAWMIEYHGITVYFGGDTAYDHDAFAATARRFPHIDLALIPIGPIEPAAYVRKHHVDADQAIQEFLDLGADHMIPIHYGTFAHGADTLDSPVVALRAAMAKAGLDDTRVHVLPIGGQLGLFHK
jgi:L-ascorbate metabolism protein UlaG (beta-lactamase superfamily)